MSVLVVCGLFDVGRYVEMRRQYFHMEDAEALDVSSSLGSWFDRLVVGVAVARA